MPPLSFEFFPPKTDEQRAQLDRTAQALKAWQPEYASVTFGAGGSTLSYTSDTVARLHATHGLPVAPHLSCMGGTRAELAALLDQYTAAGYRRIVALRGDMPSGMATAGDFRYAAELVAFIREHSGAHFHIEVAAYPETHPQAEDALRDLSHFLLGEGDDVDAAPVQPLEVQRPAYLFHVMRPVQLVQLDHGTLLV